MTLTTRGLALKVIALVSFPAFALGLVLGGGAAAPASADSHPRAYWMNKTCKNEDSNNCFWDGGDHSFYAHKIGKITCIMYANKKFAAKNDYCFKN